MWRWTPSISFSVAQNNTGEVLGYGFPVLVVTIPYCVSFDDLLMYGMVIIDKVRVVVTVDIAPVFELRQLFPYVRH